jgi:hypothetical protein
MPRTHAIVARTSSSCYQSSHSINAIDPAPHYSSQNNKPVQRLSYFDASHSTTTTSNCKSYPEAVAKWILQLAMLAHHNNSSCGCLRQCETAAEPLSAERLRTLHIHAGLNSSLAVRALSTKQLRAGQIRCQLATLHALTFHLIANNTKQALVKTSLRRPPPSSMAAVSLHPQPP